jgi:Family of unknown function (DUF5996)
VTAAWPALTEDWEPTRATLHMWTQIVGKLRLALAPPQNHFWHSTLYVTARGLTTSPMPCGSELVQIDFDFVDHQLLIATSRGERRTVALEPRSVADFYAEVMAALPGLGIEVSIHARPVEIAEPIPFAEDHVHADYDAAAVHTFWRALIQADRVFTQFRGHFLGKSSPVHFFWGGFDLAVTRFSGRRAPMWSGTVVNVHPHVMHASYSHEVSSAGFWVGSGAPPLFYSYAVPTPKGFAEAAVRPTQAAWSSEMGEFVLPYEVVGTSEQPDETLRGFLDTTYAAAADLGNWDRVLLEEQPPCLCDPPPAWSRV